MRWPGAELLAELELVEDGREADDAWDAEDASGGARPNDASDAIRVFVRARPANAREASAADIVHVDVSNSAVHLRCEPARGFVFDGVLGADSSQEDVFRLIGAGVGDACLNGYNGSVYAFGQTGGGKTYTMQGPVTSVQAMRSDERRGLVCRILEQIFGEVARRRRGPEGDEYVCKVSHLEIYKEQITDLLEPGSTNLQVREDISRGVYVERLSEHKVWTLTDALQVLWRGMCHRHVGATQLNELSSRSHSVFTLAIEATSTSSVGVTSTRSSQLNLIDLAGSERQNFDTHNAQHESLRVKEAGSVNRSLSALTNVIMSLSHATQRRHCYSPARRQPFVRYRDSKLTFLLRDSLGGNSRTVIVACVSPSAPCLGETLSTLKFAARAKDIRCKAVKNEEYSGTDKVMALEIKKLKRQLELLSSQGLLPGGRKQENLLTTALDREIRCELQQQHLDKLSQGKDGLPERRNRCLHAFREYLAFLEDSGALHATLPKVTDPTVSGDLDNAMQDKARRQLAVELAKKNEVLRCVIDQLQVRERELSELQRSCEASISRREGVNPAVGPATSAGMMPTKTAASAVSPPQPAASLWAVPSPQRRRLHAEAAQGDAWRCLDAVREAPGRRLQSPAPAEVPQGDAARRLAEAIEKDPVREAAAIRDAVAIAVAALQALCAGAAPEQLASGQPEAASELCWLLAELCRRHPGHQPVVRGAAALDAVVRCLTVLHLRGENPTVHGCWLLSILCSKHAESQRRLKLNGGLELLVSCLTSKDCALESWKVESMSTSPNASAALCAQICGCIAASVERNPENQQFLFEVGAVPAIIQVLGAHTQSPDVITNACLALTWMADKHLPSQRAAGSPGIDGPRVVASALIICSACGAARASALRCVATLTENCPSNAQAFVRFRLLDGSRRVGVLDLLLCILSGTCEDECIATAACGALANIVAAVPDVRDELCVRGGLEVALAVLRRFLCEERSCEHACRLLTAFVRGESLASHANRVKLQALGAREVLVAVTRDATLQGSALAHAQELLEHIREGEAMPPRAFVSKARSVWLGGQVV